MSSELRTDPHVVQSQERHSLSNGTIVDIVSVLSMSLSICLPTSTCISLSAWDLALLLPGAVVRVRDKCEVPRN